MRIPALPSLPPGLPAIDGPGAPPRPGVAPGGGFAGALGEAVAHVDALQVTGDRQAQDLALGHGNLHETALALEEADVALRVAVKVRNKVVEAYQDVMRMPV